MSVAYSVVIPAYNEERSIERAIRETKKIFDGLKKPYEIIVVDDGSRDQTSSIVQQFAKEIEVLRLVRHPRNLGKGAAVRTGALQAHGEIMLFLDADLATHPSEFRAFIPWFGSHDIVIGSRQVRGARIPKRQPYYRVALGQLFNLFIRHYIGIPFRDTQCGFKAFTRNTLPLFRALQTRGWAFDVELIAQAMRQGFRIKELPVVWRHGEVSRVKLAHAWQIVRELRRIKKITSTAIPSFYTTA